LGSDADNFKVLPLAAVRREPANVQGRSRGLVSSGLISLALLLFAGLAAPTAGASPAAASGAVQLVPGVWLEAVACASTTSCVAVGYQYGVDVGLVMTITDGNPGRIEIVPDTTAITSVACPTVTLCEAVGVDASYNSVVVPIANGMPGAPQIVKGSFSAVACFSAGTCEAVGGSGVVSITDGVPGTPEPVAGVTALSAVACPSADVCQAVGSTFVRGYESNPPGQIAAVTITNGTPGPAEVLPAYIALYGLACTSATGCVAVGDYYFRSYADGYPYQNDGLVVPLNNGRFGEAQLVPGATDLYSVACADAGSCQAGGVENWAQPSEGVVVPITNGALGLAQPVPDTAPLGQAKFLGIACPAPSQCEAVGASYTTPQEEGVTAAIVPGPPVTAPPVTASFNYPHDGQLGVDTTQRFGWRNVPAAQAYRLTIGTTTYGADLLDSGVLPAPQSLYDEPVLPVGPTVHATIYTEIDGAWTSHAISFTVAPSQASFTFPLDGQADVDPTEPFTWSSIPQAQGYIVVVGTRRFGTDVFNSGVLPASQLSVATPILPAGRKLYATVLTKVNGAFTRFQAIAFTTGPIAATFTFPGNGNVGVQPGWFTWNGRWQAQAYDLVIGTSRFGTSLVNTGPRSYNAAYVTGLPHGKTLYATLLTKVNGAWYYQEVVFTTA